MAQPKAESVRPRFIRIELPGKNKILSLAEVQVFGSEDGAIKNIARDGTATQSSLHPKGEAAKAIDGNTDGQWHRGYSVTHTRHGDKNPWWEVDLGAEKKIDKIVVWNRLDGDYSKRLDGFKIIALDGKRQVLVESKPKLPSPSREMARTPKDIITTAAGRKTAKRFKTRAGRSASMMSDALRPKGTGKSRPH